MTTSALSKDIQPGPSCLTTTVLELRQRGKFSLSFECSVCDRVTFATIELGRDGTLSFLSLECMTPWSKRYAHLARLSRCNPYVEVIPNENFSISCVCRRSKLEARRAFPAQGGIYSIHGSYPYDSNV